MRVLKSDFAKYNITDDDEMADDLGKLFNQKLHHLQ